MMLRKTIVGLSIGLVILIISGCSTQATSIRARSFVQAKERVDQNMEGGNYGYIFGTPVPEDRSEYKKTRNIYVVEFTKEVETPAEEDEEDDYIPPRRRPAPAPSQPRKERKAQRRQPIEIPSFDEEDISYEDTQEETEQSYVSYTVQKNDTLQKISKKFYDGYSKWKRIYEVNKSVIKDPNRIKEGMVLRIPVDN